LWRNAGITPQLQAPALALHKTVRPEVAATNGKAGNELLPAALRGLGLQLPRRLRLSQTTPTQNGAAPLNSLGCGDRAADKVEQLPLRRGQLRLGL